MKKKTPPKSKLPLQWTNFNGCREMDKDTTAKNLCLAELDTYEDFVRWLNKIQDDIYAWSCAVGWPEFYCYYVSSGWLEHTAYPNMKRDRNVYLSAASEAS